MPEDYEGGRSSLPFLLGAAPLVGYGGSRWSSMRSAFMPPAIDPMSKVVGRQSGQWFAGIEGWAPNIGQIDPALRDPILQAFKRRVGTGTPTGAVTSLEAAAQSVEGFPALKSLLRQSIEEFKGIKPGQIGRSLAAGGLAPTVQRMTGALPVTNIEALSAELSRNELMMSRVQREALRTHLEDLAALTKDMMGVGPGQGTLPTFQMKMVGDKAVSEMMVNIHRAGGPVSMTIPLPNEFGALTTPFGKRYYARRVLGNPLEYLAGAPAQEMDIAQYSIQRLRNLVVEKQGAITRRDVSSLQAEIRKQMIYTGDERGVLAAESAGLTYGKQMVVPEAGISGAQRKQILAKLAGEGRAAGLTPDAIAKGMVWTEAGMAQLPSGGVTPQHFTQAMTKGRTVGEAGTHLFQVSPSGLEAAAGQLGMGEIMPRQDVIMMSNEMQAGMKTSMVRPVQIDPSMAASKRFERIQTLLRDNATTKQMLTGGATVEETLSAYLSQTAGTPAHLEMSKQLLLKEGEFLGFTESGPEFAKTYGTKTMIRDFKTVGETTEITLHSAYDPQKVFSTGGIKHSLEYADPKAIRKLGVRAKALELLQAQGIDTKTLDVGTAAGASALKRAELQAERLYGTSQGIVVEGAGWQPWEKYKGAGKNVGRFNQMIEAEWQRKFGDLPAAYYQTEDLMKRRGILARELVSRGERWKHHFAPELLASRFEDLRPGPAAEMLGIGKAGTFTDDAFRLFNMYGWKEIAGDIGGRVQRDAPVQALLEQAVTAARGGQAGVALEELARRPGGIEGLLGDAAARAKFIQQEGGIVNLPQTYRVAGKDVSQIAIPHMGTGHTGYFTTAEGKEIVKDLDVNLRSALISAQADVGAAGVPVSELAAAGPLEAYFGNLGRIATRARDQVGGRVAGSRTFAIGRELVPDIVGKGGAIPTGAIHRATFEKWVGERMKAGLMDRSMARESRKLFYSGRLPMTAIKHPARGPLSANLFMVGPTPRGRLGWSAERNFLYLSESLLKPFVADLDFDPMPLDMFTNRNSLREATKALESGQISSLMAKHKYIREEVLGEDIKGSQRGGAKAWFRDKWDSEFLKKRAARDAASKTEVGTFTSRLSWPMGAAAEEAGLTLEERFQANFWAELMEEKTTLKARHDFKMEAGVAEELALAFQQGRHDILKQRTRDVLGLKVGHRSYFDDMLEKLTSSWKHMPVEKREQYEAMFAGRGRAGARTFMALASSDAIIDDPSKKKAVSGAGGNISKVFDRLGNTMRSHKKGLMIAAGAGAVAAMLFAQPRDLTPESVESGKVAGGPQGNTTRLPMPRMEKTVHYQHGAAPGYRVNLNMSKEIDHGALSRQLSQMAGGNPVNVNINDTRRRITRHEVQREMRSRRRDDFVNGNSASGPLRFWQA